MPYCCQTSRCQLLGGGEIIPTPLGREWCHHLDSSVKSIRPVFIAVQPEHIATKLFVGY